jgi:Dna[CI] antecedent, DciA
VTPNQYRQMLANRADRLRPLSQMPALQGLLRSAARSVRRRNAIAEIWPTLLPPDLAARTHVLSAATDVVEVACEDEVAAERVRRSARALLRLVAQRLPDVRAVRTIVSGSDVPTASDDNGTWGIDQ